ncbi:MAG: outer membrane lipoprotein-sorting protein [Deltaproteobacteria bacterium]|nr:outer membrane lipoprotein-sorting protein [Deltaproteobacteria bacterium]
MTPGSFRHPWRLAIALLVLARAARAEGDDPRELVKRVLDAVPKVALTARATLTSDRGWTRELALSRAFVDGADASYLEVTAPLDLKDTRFLLIDRAEGRDEQFIYVPTVKRAMQVSEETRKQPFLGSDFDVSDMVRPELDAFTYRVVGDETVVGRAARLVEAMPKAPEKELYAKTVSAIDPRDLLVLRVQFFDAKGALRKVWTLDTVERVDGHWIPMAQRMEDLKDGHWSRLTLAEVRYGADVSPDVFKRSHLNR